MKSANIEAETQICHECLPEKDRPEGQAGDPDFKGEEDLDPYEVEDEGSAEGTSRTQDKDRNGKPIKSSRYMKTFYGFSLEGTVRCRGCGEIIEFSMDGEEQASGFDEC